MLQAGTKVRWIMPDGVRAILIEGAAKKGVDLTLPKKDDVCTVMEVGDMPQAVRDVYPMASGVLGTAWVRIAEVSPSTQLVPAIYVSPATEQRSPPRGLFEVGMRVRCVLDDARSEKLVAASVLISSGPPIKMPKRGEVYTVKTVREVPLKLQAVLPDAADELGNIGITVEEIDEERRYPASFFEPVLS